MSCQVIASWLAGRVNDTLYWQASIISSHEPIIT